MARHVVPPHQAARPVGPYSQAVRAGGLVFLSGQLPIGPGGDLVREPPERALEACFENVKAALSDAGLTLDDVVLVTLYLADLDNFARINEAYRRIFPENPPARVTVEVSRLPLEAPLEVQVVAAEEEKPG